MYPGRHFTPDDHMVGSIGEVIAAEEYGLELFEASHPIHDAKTQDGKLIHIKATQDDRVAISERLEYWIVLRIHYNDDFDEALYKPNMINKKIASNMTPK